MGFPFLFSLAKFAFVEVRHLYAIYLGLGVVPPLLSFF